MALSKVWQNMFLEDELHVAYKIGNAPVGLFPFPHFYIEDVFSDKFYNEIQKNLPEEKFLFPIHLKRNVPETYKDRLIISLDDDDLENLPGDQAEFWGSLKKQLLGGSLKQFFVSRFQGYLKKLHPNLENYSFNSEILIVKDKKNYALGPHTDRKDKLLTMLFYLPNDNQESHLGTSMYTPKDPTFNCPGGPHYERDNFNLVYTAPFKKNSAFGFIKTSNSFHGVEKVLETNERWLLLYDIYFKNKTSFEQEANTNFKW